MPKLTTRAGVEALESYATRDERPLAQQRTICGTGTEDYFGGAYDWDVDGQYVTYTTPFLGMHQVLRPDGTYQSQHRHAMYRWCHGPSIAWAPQASTGQAPLAAWASRASSLRRTGDMTWELGPVSDAEVLPAYEALLDAACRGQRMVGLSASRPTTSTGSWPRSGRD